MVTDREFQHSPMSHTEFLERTSFYTDAGYKMVWVFDYRDKDIHITTAYNGWENSLDFAYTWKYPCHSFGKDDLDKHKNLSVWAHICPARQNFPFAQDEFYKSLERLVRIEYISRNNQIFAGEEYKRNEQSSWRKCEHKTEKLPRLTDYNTDMLTDEEYRILLNYVYMRCDYPHINVRR